MGRTPDAWGYVKRSLRLNRPKMENVLFDGKVLMNNREVPTKIQNAHRELQGINYQIPPMQKDGKRTRDTSKPCHIRTYSPLCNYI